MASYTVRAERAADHADVHRIQAEAFGRPEEADLVDLLRAQAWPQLSLVAEKPGGLAGHVFLSPVTIEGAPDAPPAAGLGPLAVAPAEQGRGAGGALVRAALAACGPIGWQAVFLLGDPAYYGRFGFELSAPRGLRYRTEAFDAAFQAIELVPGALDGCEGWVRYHRAFEGA